MRHSGLLWKFFPPLLSVIVITLILATGFAGRTLRGFMIDKTTGELERISRVLAPQVGPLVAAGDDQGVQDLCLRVGSDIGLRLTIVLENGDVIGDSENRPAMMDNHGDRTEIIEAFAGRTGSSLRFSATLKHQRLYVAVPGEPGPAAPFVVRTSVSLEELSGRQKTLYAEIAEVGLILAILAGLISFLLSRRISNALGQLQRGAEAFSNGDLGRRIRVEHSREMSAVAEDMNSMAGQLAERIGTMERQQNELEAVLSSMVEGVVAVDANETVIRMNHTACRLLGRTAEMSLGRSIQEVGHNPHLIRMVQASMTDPHPQSGDVHLGGIEERLLKVQATGLIGADGEQIGVLLVMNDVTRLRRLQTMRQDFVANVSHELRTPITSIRGFVETLLEDPPEDAAESRRFLDIIDRQAERLGRIVDDLLALSRLEKEAGGGEIELWDMSLKSLLERVLRDLHSRDPETAKRVRLACEAEISCRLNAPLMEQAIGNLLDNALKYSPETSPIIMSCEVSDTAVEIHVADEGPGIDAEHLPRLFERFYRVDRARSRKMGGTGLGLAIVKHIAQAHGGRATVASKPGRGSTFTLVLPREVPE